MRKEEGFRSAGWDRAEVSTGWPERVIELTGRWGTGLTGAARDRVLGQLWQLLNAALLKYLRIHQGRLGRIEFEDARDIASEKSLELLQRFDGKEWDPASGTPAQLCTFISTLARNGLIDHIRVHRSKRHLPIQPGDDGDPTSVESHVGLARGAEAVPADVVVIRGQFARALLDCVSRLSPRDRRIWFMRVMLGMSSKKIAGHPKVDIGAPAIDVALSRMREKIRQCMAAKGHDTRDIPTGAFTVLWEVFRRDSAME